MARFLVLEIGKAVCTESLMKNGEYRPTEDAALVLNTEARSEEDAIEKAKTYLEGLGRDYDNLVAHKVGDSAIPSPEGD